MPPLLGPQLLWRPERWSLPGAEAMRLAGRLQHGAMAFPVGDREPKLRGLPAW